MSKATLEAALLSITLDRSARPGLQAQLLHQLRGLVHSGRLSPGDRLPSSRGLAEELSVSRVTVTVVFDQLIAEGYLEARRGSGVFVAADLPDLPAPTASTRAEHKRAAPASSRPLQPFETAAPDLREFPFQDWARLSEQVWRRPEPALLGRAEPFGWPPLRAAIAGHLSDWRGITCRPEQIVITSGLVDAIERIAEAALDRGQRVLVEEPGHDVLRRALSDCGLGCQPLPVDSQGIDIESAPDGSAAIAVTPSRQFPLGMTLSLARRLRLLAWAEAEDGLVIEDDFDGEVRYRGQPLPALMSLDEQQRVIYVGSFSKVLFPALRLGFLVLPPRLIEAVRGRMAASGPRASLFAQPVLARFIEEGAFATHIRRMRRLYAKRQQSLLAAAGDLPPDLLMLEPAAGGMHLVARLAPGIDDQEVSLAAARHGLTVSALSTYFAGPASQQGLILGYAGFTEDEIFEGIATLGRVLAEVSSPRRGRLRAAKARQR